jgi:phosphatidylinositol alpha 1,6-mannosyltransferase
LRIEGLRVALFPDAYLEIDGVAKTSRHFEEYAKQRGLPFLIVHAGSRNLVSLDGSVTRFQCRRSQATFPLDRHHHFDLLFLRHYRKIAAAVREFSPDVIHITGPSDVGILGALLAHRLDIPLAASWQTNLHQYARTRLSEALSIFPNFISSSLPSAVERWTFGATARFYKIPKLLFAPNQELVAALQKSTGKPCYLMSHAVDTAAFSPDYRDRQSGPFTIGYVGRLTAEKNVRALARLEQRLLSMGRTDFRIVLVGQGAEEKWLRKNMRKAEFTGLLSGRELSRAFANMDVFVFPSETDTFGLAVLEALASGVPAVVSSVGGPKFTVQHGRIGFVSSSPEEFAVFTDTLMNQPELLASMRASAREFALATSWENIFDGMYRAYERCSSAAEFTTREILHAAKN